MKLSVAAHQQFEAFFRQHLDDEDFCLPVVYFHAGRLSRLLTAVIGVHGITFGKRMFIAPSLISLNQNNQPQISADLAAHEIAHVLQYQREGFLRFLYGYTTDYRKNLRRSAVRNEAARHEAYRQIPHEMEARDIAAKFVEWRRDAKKV